MCSWVVSTNYFIVSSPHNFIAFNNYIVSIPPGAIIEYRGKLTQFYTNGEYSVQPDDVVTITLYLDGYLPCTFEEGLDRSRPASVARRRHGLHLPAETRPRQAARRR